MQIKQLFEDEDAVSPVIGVILMVAITVILAAVIGTFVLGLGDQVQDNAPQASFTFDYVDSGGSPTCTGYGGATDDALTVTHDGGDKIQADKITLTDGSVSKTWATCSSLAASSDVSAGNQAKLDPTSSDTVRVVWQADSGGSSATLGKWTGPDA